MKSLLDEYKRTAKQTKVMQRELNDKIAGCEHDMDIMKSADAISSVGRDQEFIRTEDVKEWSTRYKELNAFNRFLKQEKEIVNSMVSSLTYSIHCIRYNTEPPALRGIERRSYSEREVPFENQWIEKRKDGDAYADHIALLTEKTEEEKYEEEIRKELVGEIKKCLTDRQIEVMELIGMDFTPLDIAKMLGITKRAVNYTIEAARQKVKDEGWRMV